MSRNLFRVGLAVAAALSLAACSSQPIPVHMQPLSKDAMMLLGKKGMKPEAPIFVRIFKEESELEIWKAREDGHYYHFKTYPICNWSGDIGPKEAQGDKQAPEGFYTIRKDQMNPNSSFHLAFNLGYPNAYDRAHKRTGEFLMVHGKCKSAGCYAMTDALIEEIYALAREQFVEGQEAFDVHAFPFRMTEQNLEQHRRQKWYPFWKTLKEAYDHFEETRQPPSVAVCEKRYLVNARFLQTASTRIDPEGICPPYERPQIAAFRAAGKDQTAEAHARAPGPKMRSLAAGQSEGTSGGGGILSGLFRSRSQTPLLGFRSQGGE